MMMMRLCKMFISIRIIYSCAECHELHGKLIQSRTTHNIHLFCIINEDEDQGSSVGGHQWLMSDEHSSNSKEVQKWDQQQQTNDNDDGDGDDEKNETAMVIALATTCDFHACILNNRLNAFIHTHVS